MGGMFSRGSVEILAMQQRLFLIYGGLADVVVLVEWTIDESHNHT